jgi:Ankyrin repeat
VEDENHLMADCLQNGLTALLYASCNGHTDIVRELLSVPGIDVNVVTKVIDTCCLCGIDFQLSTEGQYCPQELVLACEGYRVLPA